MHIPTHSILLVPANLHLAAYQSILQEYGQCIDIEVISLSTYISRFQTIEEFSDIQHIEQFAHQLNDLDSSNAFFQSRKDPAFLHACLDFLTLCQYYRFDDYPISTNKEKDLKDILKKLDVLLDRKEYELPYAPNVYILRHEYTTADYYWIDQLLDKGAQWLEKEHPQSKKYISVANARKQAEFVAQEIIEQNYNAQDCMIALSEPKDQAVMTQMLDQRKIPYTCLSNHRNTQIFKQWSACLEWLKDKSVQNYIQIMRTLYPSMAPSFESYLELFPENFPAFEKKTDILYEPNVFMDAYNWEKLQRLEDEILSFQQEHPMFTSIEEIAQVIQDINEPTSENIQAFQSVQTILSETNDLDILRYEIESLSDKVSPDSIEGVLIGSRNDISIFRKHTFLVGAHAKVFPNYSQQTGIFNEAYFSHTSLPSLSERLERQEESLFKVLEQPDTLTVVIPEFDYTQKSYETSVELNDWMQEKPTFVAIDESSNYRQPQFNLDTTELFFPNKTYRGSISRFESFASCPLKHYLKYGLKLEEPRQFTDLSVRGSLLHELLERIAQDHNKNYTLIDEAQMHDYVQSAFDWIERTFPSKRFWIETQKSDIEQALKLVLTQLKEFESKWHMNVSKQEHKIEKSFTWNGYTIQCIGYIDRIDESQSSFCIFDYKSGDRKLEPQKFALGLSLQLATYSILYQEESQLVPVGNFYIILKTTPQVQEGMKLYGKAKDNIKVYEKEEFIQSFEQSNRPNGWAYQDITTYADQASIFSVSKKSPSFHELKEQWEQIIDSLLHDIESNDISPRHDKDACTYCQYGTICRNAKEEVIKESRLENEVFK